MHLKKLRSKVVSLGVAAAMIAAVATPVSALAQQDTQVPTTPLEADEYVTTVAAHRAAETAPQFLGANLTTMQTNVSTLAAATTSPVFNVFGSDWNTAPDPYLLNYYYNQYVADYNSKVESEEDKLEPVTSPLVALMTQTVGPTGADGSGVSASTNPDIYLGNAPMAGYSYPDSYNSMAYNCGNLAELIDTMYQLSYEMNDVLADKLEDAEDTPDTEDEEEIYSGRYGNPEYIANDYEKYIKGVQLYVLSQLADNNASKKKVAIVGVNTNGTYKLYDSNMSSGTAASCRAAEYLECTTDNVIDDFDDTVNTDALTAAQLKGCGAEYIFTSGVQGNGTLTQTLTNADAIPDGAVVVDQLPSYVYGISMNSVENALGVGIFQSIVYDEYLELEDAVAYFYNDFYHLDDSVIDGVADEYFANFVQYGYETNKYTSSTIGNAISNYEDILEDGISYFIDNVNDDDELASSKLVLTNDYYLTIPQ